VIATYGLRELAQAGTIAPAIFYNSSEWDFYNFHFAYAVTWELWHRNFGIFREPGVYQFFVLLAVYLNNYAVDWNKQWHMWLCNVILAVTMVLVTVLLAGVAFLMFTGDIVYTVTDTALNIDVDYHSDLTVSLDTIDSVVLHQGKPGGTRTWGFASARLLLGWFESDELGNYARYTYTGCDSYILLTSGEEILVLSARTESETQALYEQLKEAVK
jgi:hypothetical protein